MRNIDKAIEKNRAEWARRDKLSLELIKSMVEANEPITIKELVKRTGFSREYFYVNKTVREALLEAQEFQKKRMPVLKQELENQTVEQQLISLARKNERLRMEVAILKCENRDLKEQWNELLKDREESMTQRL